MGEVIFRFPASQDVSKYNFSCNNMIMAMSKNDGSNNIIDGAGWTEYLSDSS